MILVEGLLGAARLVELDGLLAAMSFLPGQNTGPAAIKNNLQSNPQDANYAKASGLVVQALSASPEFRSYARPNKITPINFARYGAGMSYGDHVDAAVQTLPNMLLRTDLSFTIFLSDPASYEGGELVIKHAGSERSIKASAGSMFLYPTGVVHRVNPIRSGWRNVAIGWIQSLVANHEQRDILYQLQTARDGLLGSAGRSPEFELVESVFQNLLRMFVQP